MNFRNRSVSLATIILCAVGISILALFLMINSRADTGQVRLGDLDSNGKVDVLDLSKLLSNFNKVTSLGDVDGDGKVTITDMSILLSNFGKTTAPTPTTNAGCSDTTGWAYCEDFNSYSNAFMKTGGLSGTPYYAKWTHNQACSNRTSIADDPVRSGKSVKMLVNNKDQRYLTDSSGKILLDANGNQIKNPDCPNQPNQNPRSQLITQYNFKKGDDTYMSVGTFFPSDFPRTIGLSSYLQITEIYGSPTKCGPPVGIFVVGSRLQFNQVTGIAATDSNGDCTSPKVSSGIWKAPSDIRYGQAWEKFTLRVKFSDNVVSSTTTSTNPDDGFIEIWYNGVKQKFSNGTTRHYMRTLLPGVNYNVGGTNALYVNSYRGATAWDGDLTLYHDDIKIGNTFESVQ
jgi:Polysaccharide lyase